MTGFGTGVASDGEHRARVEIRSVNHRYRDVLVHMPYPHVIWEERIRRLLDGRISRGRIEIFVILEGFGDRKRTVTLNSGLLAGYADALAEAAPVIGSPTVTLESLLLIPELFVVEDDLDAESMWPLIEQALVLALDELIRMRQAEGQSLQADILERLVDIEEWIEDIEERVPVVVKAYRDHLAARLDELADSVPVAEERIASEVVVFADRSCITEELVRAKTHIRHFREACDSEDPVGRKLDFLLQELNREVNTMASKAADSQIATLVVDIKAQLEKVREQVQNIE